jgi:hypothetical protein
MKKNSYKHISLLKRSKQNIKYKTNDAKFFKEAGKLKKKSRRKSISKNNIEAK